MLKLFRLKLLAVRELLPAIQELGCFIGQALCSRGLHRGEWEYGVEGSSCDQARICQRCGTQSSRTKHQGEWRYANQIECMEIKSCLRCGKRTPYPLALSDLIYGFDRPRYRHVWTKWEGVTRSCTRCSKTEVGSSSSPGAGGLVLYLAGFPVSRSPRPRKAALRSGLSTPALLF